MSCDEFWFTYHQLSRAGHPETAQLIDLQNGGCKLADLEDVLDYVFSQGFIDAKHRSVSYWERKDGCKVKSSALIEHILKDGVGLCEQTALRLVVADFPSALWFSYVNVNAGYNSPLVTQRVKTGAAYSGCRMEKLAHVTNYIFEHGFIPSKFRSMVYWENRGGLRLGEHTSLQDLFYCGEGMCEDQPLRLVIDKPSYQLVEVEPVCEKVVCEKVVDNCGHVVEKSSFFKPAACYTKTACVEKQSCCQAVQKPACYRFVEKPTCYKPACTYVVEQPTHSYVVEKPTHSYVVEKPTHPHVVEKSTQSYFVERPTCAGRVKSCGC